MSSSVTSISSDKLYPFDSRQAFTVMSEARRFLCTSSPAMAVSTVCLLKVCNRDDRSLRRVVYVLLVAGRCSGGEEGCGEVVVGDGAVVVRYGKL